jgi:hypothetical protein
MSFTKETLLDKEDDNSLVFSKLRKGGVRSCVFNMCCTAIGVGTMSIPYAFAQCSLLPGIVIVAVSAFLSWWSLGMLVQASASMKSLNYMEICQKSIGNWLGYVLELFVVLCLFGMITLFQIMCNCNDFRHSDNILSVHKMWMGIARAFFNICLNSSNCRADISIVHSERND